MELDFLNLVCFVVLAAFAMWFAWGTPVTTIKGIWHMWRRK